MQVNVVKLVFDEIKKPSRHIFKNSLKEVVFLEKIKIPKTGPIFKISTK